MPVPRAARPLEHGHLHRRAAPRQAHRPAPAQCPDGWSHVPGLRAKNLAPELHRGDLVVCDNLSSHKVSGVREAIEHCGAELLYLPACSPGLNPIELAFAKLKAFLRQRAQRTFAGLRRATAQALDSFTPAHCTHFFHHATYATD